MRSIVSSLFRDVSDGCRWLAGGCRLGFAKTAVESRSAGRSFVTAMAGLAIVLSLVALASPAAFSAEEAVAEAIVDIAVAEVVAEAIVEAEAEVAAEENPSA